MSRDVRRRVLMLVHDFPPASGGGILRPLKFATYLPRFGWSPVVLTVRADSYAERDETLLAGIGSGVEIVRTRTLLSRRRARAGRAHFGDEAGEGGRLQSSPMNWIRDRFLVPDARVLWWPFALPRALGIHLGRGFDAIYATAPPFSTLVLGRHLKRLTGKPLICDFRDPWSHGFDEIRPEEHPDRLLRESRMEDRVVQAADAIIAPVPAIRDKMWDTFPDDVATRIHLITNGFDPADQEGIEPRRFERFAVVYTGKTTGLYVPAPAIEALEALLSADPALASRLEVHFLGRFNPEFAARVAESPLADLVTFHGHVDYRTTLSYQLGADLLLVIWPRTDAIPGKIFEYLYTGVPILAVMPLESDGARLIRETGAGIVVPESDAGGVALVLRDHLAKWTPESRARRRPGRRSDPAVLQYTRENLTRRLAEILDRITGAA